MGSTIYLVMYHWGNRWRGNLLVRAKTEVQAEKYTLLQLKHSPKSDITLKTEEATQHQLLYAEKMHSKIHDACITGGKQQ